MVQCLAYFWAFPASCIGLLFAILAWVSGGRSRIIGGVIEVHGGLVTRFLASGCGTSHAWSAMTLGHVVLGRSEYCLANSRAHERIHVRQYERWGVFFFPAYLLSSLIARLRGRDAYFDNVFEIEAYESSAKVKVTNDLGL